MPKSNIESELRSRVEAFVADLTEIIHQAALASVHEAIEGTMGISAPARRGPGRPRKAGKAARKATKRASAKNGGRARRSPEELEQLSSGFLSYVQANPGQRLGEIGAGMGIDTKELKRPVTLLLEAGSIRTEGQRRGTKYFAGSGGPRKATKRKAAKKKASKKGKRKSSKKRASRKGTTRAAA